jgi:hypothetical protein
VIVVFFLLESVLLTLYCRQSVPAKAVGVSENGTFLELSDNCGFVLDAMPDGQETQVSFVLGYKKHHGKKRPAVLAQSVLLGMLLTLGGSVESKPVELDSSLNFLKRL